MCSSRSDEHFLVFQSARANFMVMAMVMVMVNQNLEHMFNRLNQISVCPDLVPTALWPALHRLPVHRLHPSDRHDGPCRCLRCLGRCRWQPPGQISCWRRMPANLMVLCAETGIERDASFHSSPFLSRSSRLPSPLVQVWRCKWVPRRLVQGKADWGVEMAVSHYQCQGMVLA